MTAFALALLVAKTTLVLLAARAVTRALQRAAAGARHVVWVVTLAALLAIPAVGAWAPLRIAALPPAVDAVAPIRNGMVSHPAIRSEGVERPSTSSMSGGGPTAPAVERPDAATEPAAPRALQLPGLTTLVLLAWAFVALLVGGAYAHGWLAVRRIVRGARPLAGRDWLDTLYDASDRLELAEPPRLLRSADSTMPFACGIAHPTIVLPAEADDWSAERRRAVLLHELAHVRRRDLVGHTFARFVCAVYWFHPLVWAAARHLRAESERACDDLALVCGERPADYAEHLLDIVTSVRRDRTPLVALAMARRSEFEGRMLAILDPDRPRAVNRGRRISLAAGGLAALALVIGAVAPTRRQAAAAEQFTRHTSAVAQLPPPSPAAAEAKPVGTPAAPAPSVGATTASPTGSPAGAAFGAPSHTFPQVQTRKQSRTDSNTETRLERRVDTRIDGVAARALAGIAVRPGDDTTGDRADLLARILRTDTSASIRRVAAWGLAEYGRSSVGTEALIAALRGDRDADVREMAAWALAETDGRAAGVAGALAVALRDGDQRVRATAAWSLGSVGESGAGPVLVRALADSSPRVRQRAVWALGNLDLRDAPPALVALLRDPDARTRLIASWALYNIADPSTAPALQTAIHAEKDPRVQIGELRAIAALGDRSVETIRELLDSSDSSVRDMAVRALAGGRATGPWPWPWPEPRPNP